VFNPFKAKIRIDHTGWYGGFRGRICLQKDDAECVEACPRGALYRDERRGLVAFDPDRCDGCGHCIDACPHDAIFSHPEERVIFKCDLCGGGRVQQCVEACPRDALSVEDVGP
jgi:tetrathionate reductase subunit B